MKKLIVFKILVILLLVMNILVLENDSVQAFTIDEIITGGDSFISTGDSVIASQGSPIEQSKLKATSDTIYKVLLGIAIVVAVIVGAILGIQFMLASAEDKAKYKEALIPFVLGCFVAFGAFGIWKLAMTIMGSV